MNREESKSNPTVRDSKRYQELLVLESELISLKQSAKVYRQQPNSCLFFLDNQTNVLMEMKKELNTYQGKK